MNSKTVILIAGLMVAQNALAEEAFKLPPLPKVPTTAETGKSTTPAANATKADSAKPATSLAKPAPADIKLASPTHFRARENEKVDLYRQLDELRSQNVILTESLKNAELKNKILNTGKSPAVQTSPNPSMPMSPMSFSAPATAQVQMVSGSERNITALISLPSGGRVTVKTGSIIPGLGIVKSITVNEVVVAGNSETIVVPFAGDASSGAMMPGGLR